MGQQNTAMFNIENYTQPFFLNNLFCCDCASKWNCKNTLLGPPLANSILMYEHVGKYKQYYICASLGSTIYILIAPFDTMTHPESCALFVCVSVRERLRDPIPIKTYQIPIYFEHVFQSK